MILRTSVRTTSAIACLLAVLAMPWHAAAGGTTSSAELRFEVTLSDNVDGWDSWSLARRCTTTDECGFSEPFDPMCSADLELHEQLGMSLCQPKTYVFTSTEPIGSSVDYALLRWPDGNRSQEQRLLPGTVVVPQGGMTIRLGYRYPASAHPSTAPIIPGITTAQVIDHVEAFGLICHWGFPNVADGPADRGYRCIDPDDPFDGDVTVWVDHYGGLDRVYAIGVSSITLGGSEDIWEQTRAVLRHMAGLPYGGADPDRARAFVDDSLQNLACGGPGAECSLTIGQVAFGAQVNFDMGAGGLNLRGLAQLGGADGGSGLPNTAMPRP
jgi:hypothetical protein